MRRLHQTVMALVLGLGATCSDVAAAAPDFERAVAPILEAKCLSCHTPEEAKGDVVLANRSESAEHLKKIVALVSGPEPDMPKDGKPLTSEQVEILRQWIESGAEWTEGRVLTDKPQRDLDWWSLRPIADAVPGRTVDEFVDAKLKEKKLPPAVEAEPLVLIRRVTYDLTGLPPTPAEIDAFLPAWEADGDSAWSALVSTLR